MTPQNSTLIQKSPKKKTCHPEKSQSLVLGQNANVFDQTIQSTLQIVQMRVSFFEGRSTWATAKFCDNNIRYYFLYSNMKKASQSGKLPSFRMTIEKRVSANDNLLTSSKPEFGQEITNEDPVLSTTQTEISKKIQSKLRVRRSQKCNTRQNIERPTTNEQTESEVDHNEDFSIKLGEIWESNAEVSAIITAFGSTVPADEVRRRLLRQAGVLQCQSTGHNLEQLVAGRVKRLFQLMASERRCGEHEQLMTRLIEDRMRKLNDVLRTR